MIKYQLSFMRFPENVNSFLSSDIPEKLRDGASPDRTIAEVFQSLSPEAIHMPELSGAQNQG